MRRICLAVVLGVCLIGSASAQRTLVPLFDHIDIPVNSDHELTVAQVRRALRAAAAIEGWGSTMQPDGTLQLNAVKNFKHPITLSVAYKASSYSVRYVESSNLNFAESPAPSAWPLDAAKLPMSSRAAAKQAEQFKALPDFKYAVQRQGFELHPNYEEWIYELLGSMRRQINIVE